MDEQQAALAHVNRAWEWFGAAQFAGETGPGAIGLRVIVIAALACLLLGVAGRTAALVIVVLYLWRMSELGATPERLWIFGGACLVVVLGSGAWSLAAPETRLFRREA